MLGACPRQERSANCCEKSALSELRAATYLRGVGAGAGAGACFTCAFCREAFRRFKAISPACARGAPNRVFGNFGKMFRLRLIMWGNIWDWGSRIGEVSWWTRIALRAVRRNGFLREPFLANSSNARKQGE